MTLGHINSGSLDLLPKIFGLVVVVVVVVVVIIIIIIIIIIIYVSSYAQLKTIT